MHLQSNITHTHTHTPQALVTVTLGNRGMAQRQENLDGSDQKRFYLQYSFPPSSVGEVGKVGAPGRREIGHGNLG